MSAVDYTALAAQIDAAIDGDVFLDVPMAQLTTFKIGGPAKLVVEPSGIADVLATLLQVSEAGAELRVVGCGSNILAADEGLDCAIMHLGPKFASIQIEDGLLFAEAGATNEEVAAAAQEAGLAGYEFASGIPGTIGGAAYMNAGAYDGEFRDVAHSIVCITRDGSLVELDRFEARFGYRRSLMMDEDLIVVGVTIELEDDDPDAIQERMDDLKQRREEKQPLDIPSAGSTFKRPEGYFAGKLIQDAGLKGYRVGDAMVSTKHSGFVVNAGNATAADVLQVIGHIQETVQANEGVHMEPEVRIWR